MARKYFTTGDLDIVLVGNVSAFRDALKKQFAGAEFTEIPFDQVDVLSPVLRASPQATATLDNHRNPDGRGCCYSCAHAGIS